jgi:hypothetical protein
MIGVLKHIWLFPLVFALAVQAQVQPVRLNWMQLQRVPTRPVSLDGVEGVLPLPVFPSSIKELQGKQVDIDGYVIPLDKSGKTVVLSAYAMAECFFCGKASPASVMTIKLKKPSKNYKTDQIITFRGRLHLNDTDPKELFYVLEEGIPINE